MDSCLITFRSVTPAQRGESALRREGIACAIQRTPKQLADQSCGYSLRVRFQDAVRCAELLRAEEVPFRKIYLRRENGSIEELSL